MESHRGAYSVQDPFGVIVDSPLPADLTHVPFTRRQTTYAYSQLKTTTVLNSSPFKIRSHYYNFLNPSFKPSISYEVPRSHVLNQHHPLQWRLDFPQLLQRFRPRHQRLRRGQLRPSRMPAWLAAQQQRLAQSMAHMLPPRIHPRAQSLCRPSLRFLHELPRLQG